jgi:hypothetical protein
VFLKLVIEFELSRSNRVPLEKIAQIGSPLILLTTNSQLNSKNTDIKSG